jgi:hypothetical protein
MSCCHYYSRGLPHRGVGGGNSMNERNALFALMRPGADTAVLPA